ncbi:hypothetical protein B0H13DRAFT_1853762 [Mycena leptocephala]|nr:hypothetical protein B0H13DRAFT_1853762 [Mycena leptocephala]
MTVDRHSSILRSHHCAVELEYMPGSEMPEERLDVDVSTDEYFEVDPPVFDNLAADAGQGDDIPALINGESTRSGRKHRVYDTQAACDCGEIVMEDQRADSACAVRCTKMGCETEWYHRDCFEGYSAQEKYQAAIIPDLLFTIMASTWSRVSPPLFPLKLQ